MKYIILTILLLNLQLVVAQNETKAIEGTWKIDLRPTPDAEAYYQNFEISDIKNNKFIGKFYGSNLKDALLNRSWNRLYFAFTTSDSSHTYYHSGYFLDDKVYGISYCPTRKFTAPWTGIKQ